VATGQQHVLLSGQLDRNTLALGSYEPDDARTGVPSGTTLTPVSGNQIVTTPGTVLQDLDITGYVDVRTSNVTIRRCRIRGDVTASSHYGLVHCPSGNVTNLLIEDCTLAGEASTVGFWINGVHGHDYTARRNRIYNVIDGLGVFNTVTPGAPSNVVAEGNYVGPLLYWLNQPDHTDGSHNDGIQIHGGVGTIVRYNKFWAFNATDLADGAGGGPNGPTQTQSLSCVMLNSNTGDPYDVEIYENWCYGGSVGFNFSDDALGAPGETVAIAHRNRFKQGTQWFTAVPILYEATATFDLGAGTVDKNYWMDSGLEVPLNTG